MKASHITEQELFERVRRVAIATKVPRSLISPENVTRESRLTDAPLAMDSIEIISMIVGVEDEFGVVVAEEDFTFSQIQDLGDLVKLVKRSLDTSICND